MILVAAGTRDGRELAAYLREKGLPVLITVVSSYGGLLARDAGETLVQSLSFEDFTELFRQKGVTAAVDASHPYAAAASSHIMNAARAAGIVYVRYERENTPLPSYERLYIAEDARRAAELAAGLGRTVFLTTGSRSLAVFKNAPELRNKRLVARILPDAASLAVCAELGFLPRDIVAMQGPFGKDLNKALFQAFAAEVIVTKDSGRVGGADEKLSAAMELALPVVLITRPALNYSRVARDFASVYELVRSVENGSIDRPPGD
jgi:precorrin-6A/cobalt-precorrin-6A reductase